MVCYWKSILFGKRAKCNRRTGRFERQRFYSKQSLFYKKTILEQGLLHHKRTQPVKEMQLKIRKKHNALMNVANFRCQSWLLERRMLLRHWLCCFQIGYVTFSKWINYNKHVFLHKKGTDLLNMLLYLDTNDSGKDISDRKLFKEDFFPPLQEERCIKTTVLNTQLLLWWKNWFILWSKCHLHRWYLNLHLRRPISRTKGCNHVGIWFKQKWIIVSNFC